MNKTKIVDKIGDILTVGGAVVTVADLFAIAFLKAVIHICNMQRFLTIFVWGITAVIIGVIFWAISGILENEEN